MHPLFTEILAKQHMEQLRCEALAERNAALLKAHSRRLEDLEGAAVHRHSLEAAPKRHQPMQVRPNAQGC
jgi:hypothetical protein